MAKTITVKATGVPKGKKMTPAQHMKEMQQIIKKFPKEKMDLWHLGNEIDAIAMKLGSVSGIAVLLAESCGDPQSSAAWAISDYLNDLDKQLHELSEKVIQAHK